MPAIYVTMLASSYIKLSSLHSSIRLAHATMVVVLSVYTDIFYLKILMMMENTLKYDQAQTHAIKLNFKVVTVHAWIFQMHTMHHEHVVIIEYRS